MNLIKFLQTITIFLGTLILTLKIAYAAQPVSPGGSNYAWYKIDATTQPALPGVNCRENYGILKNYQKANVRNIVIGQLQQMKANGQDRLRIPILHAHDAQGGTLLVSNGGNLSMYDRESLRLFLSDIKNTGFREILIGFFPVGQNSPSNWPTWNEVIFQENWNLIFRLHPIIAGAGISYRIDLGNEGAPANHQTMLKEYVKKLWINYNIVFGKADTVGFSLASDTGNPLDINTVVDRYNTTTDIYISTGYGSPYVWDIHFYNNLKGKYNALDNAMTARGDTASIIIGETFYNDPTIWSEIQQINTSRTIWHVYQWPLTRSMGCDGHVDITPPLNYSYY